MRADGDRGRRGFGERDDGDRALRADAAFRAVLLFVTAETWSWWHTTSVHNARWPTDAEVLDAIGGADADASAVYLRDRRCSANPEAETLLQLSAGAAVTTVTISTATISAAPRG